MRALLDLDLALSPWALLLYWLPLAICAVGYLLRTAAEIRKDRQRREWADAEQARGRVGLYVPHVTLGMLIGRVLATLVPVVNLFASVFDIAPVLFHGFLRRIERALSQPIVPKRKRGDGDGR